MRTRRVLRTAKDRHLALVPVHLVKYYCLRCEMPGICKCSMADKKFRYAPKIRPPLSTKNKERFRTFLRACPEFVNCVPEELREDFRKLLRKVKFFDQAINGAQWTRVSAS